MKLFPVFTSLILLTSISLVSADPITVGNYSFENPGGQQINPTGVNTIADFTFNDGDGYSGSQAFADPSGGGTTSFSNAGTSQGATFAFLNLGDPGNSATITYTGTGSDSLGTVQANTTYTLTVALGNSNKADNLDYALPGTNTLSLLAGGNAIQTTTVPIGTVPNGTFKDYSVTFTTGTTDSFLGEALSFQLGALDPSNSGIAIQSDYDNVRLDASAVPEPSTYAMLLSGLLGLGFLARRKSFGFSL